METLENRINNVLLILAISLIGASGSVAAEDKEDGEAIEFSGFARVVGGLLREDDVNFGGYEDKFRFSEQSLIAVQTDIELSEKLSFTTQLLAHSSDSRDSGVEWAYLSYRPTDQLTIQAGKLRTPFYLYSDVIDVGYAYPWITPPNQVYTSVLFSNYEGIKVSYEFALAEMVVDLQGYTGGYDNRISSSGNNFDSDVEDLSGVILNLYYENLSFRAAYHTADAEIDIEGLTFLSDQVRAAGFANSADSLLPIGETDVYQAGLSYDGLTYFFKSEWSEIESDILIVPDIQSFYATVGYNLPPFSFHVTYSDSSSDLPTPLQEIPLGVAPQLDGLAFAYNTAFSEISGSDMTSLSVGARWDVQPNLALKIEVSDLDIDDASRSSFLFARPPASFDGQASLMQVALEWVF